MTANLPYADQPGERAAASHPSTDSDIDLQTGPAETWEDWGSEDVFGQGDYELEERNALRRVAGLSTELEDVSEVEYRQLRLERVVLVSVWSEGTQEEADNSLVELKLLAETAGSQVLDALSQRRQKPDPATYIGPGKVQHLAMVVADTGADTVICDGELSPSQLRNLEDRVKVKVVDRTALILDIFAQHARSKEGKAQVELAQLEYGKQRLRGWGGNLSRQAGGRVGSQGGGIGGRGPGETKLETDRRRISTRMAKLRRELEHMQTARVTKKAERVRRQVPAVAITGYTNAGKSSLLNRLTGSASSSRMLCSQPWTRPRGAPPHATGGSTPSPTPSASSGTCHTSSSRPSGPRWRRSPTLTWCCTSSTGPTLTPRARSRLSGRCWPRSALAACRS